MNLNWKYVLFVVNFLFVITGVIMIAVGVSVKTYYTQYDIFLNDSYFSLPNLLIATGVLIFIISFFGCCGAWKESWFMIFIFSILLGLIFILEFSAGIAGYVLRDKTSNYLETSLQLDLKEYKFGKPTVNSKTKMWDIIQEEFACCGVKNASDWKMNKDNANLTDTDLPASCCRPLPGATGSISCNLLSNTTASYYKQGCVEGFGRFLKSHAVTLGGVGIAIAFVQLFAVIFSCHLSRSIKNQFYST